MDNKIRYSSALVLIGLTLGASIAGCSTTYSKGTNESSSEQIQDQESLGEKINDYNNQNNSEAPAIGHDNKGDQYSGGDASTNPRAKALAADVDRYNGKSEPDQSVSTIDARQPSQVELDRRAREEQATEKLSQEVRAYNRNGGSSNRATDDNR